MLRNRTMTRTMTRPHSITGSLYVYLSSVMLLSCLPSAAQNIRAPTVVRTMHKRLVNGYRIGCKVEPGGLKDETMVYWLADGEFIEKVYKNISVTQTERKSRNGTVHLYTKVVFKNFSQEDFHTDFTCVALSPAGFAKECLQLNKAGRQ